jgi:hypothetical protein
MRQSRLLIVAFLGAWALPIVAQSINLRPGRYETVVDIELPNGQKMPMKNTDCITAADLKDGVKTFLEEMGENCKISGLKATGNQMRFNATCTDDDVTMTTTAEMTFAGDAFSGLFKAKDDKGQQFTFKMSGKRLGDCTQ